MASLSYLCPFSDPIYTGFCDGHHILIAISIVKEAFDKRAYLPGVCLQYMKILMTDESFVYTQMLYNLFNSEFYRESEDLLSGGR